MSAWLGDRAGIGPAWLARLVLLGTLVAGLPGCERSAPPPAPFVAAAGDFGLVDGAVWDAEAGALILTGDGSALAPPAPGLVAAALRQVFADDPGSFVSIDPTAPDQAAAVVAVNEAARDTELGWIMFEADRRLKVYQAGTDNVLGIAMRPRVSGFRDGLELGFSADCAHPPGISPAGPNRFWLAPGRIEVQQDATALRILTAEVRVNTESMQWRAGLLETARGADGQPPLDPSARCFAEFVTLNYEALATADPVFRELQQVLRLLTVARWARTHGLMLNRHWIEWHAAEPFRMPVGTPGVRASGVRVTRHGDGYEVQTRAVSGGVDFTELPITPLTAGAALSDGARAVLARARAPGALPARLLMVAGQAPPTATRLSGPFGDRLVLPARQRRNGDWVPDMPRLWSSNPHAATSQREVFGIEGHLDSMREVRTWQLFDRGAWPIGVFESYEIDQSQRRVRVRPVMLGNPWALYPHADGGAEAVGPNGRSLTFDAAGRPTAERIDGLTLAYRYDAQGSLHEIAETRTGAADSWIRLEPGCNGACVVAARGPDGQRVAMRDEVLPGGLHFRLVLAPTGMSVEPIPVTLDGATGNWQAKTPQPLAFLAEHGAAISRAIASRTSFHLFGDGGMTLLLSRAADGEYWLYQLPQRVTDTRALQAAIDQALPDGHPLVDILPAEHGAVALLRETTGQRPTHALLWLAGHGPARYEPGDARALAHFRSLQRRQLAPLDGEGRRFVVAHADGDHVVLASAGRTLRLSATQWHALAEGLPNTPLQQVHALLGVGAGTERVIVVRDVTECPAGGISQAGYAGGGGGRGPGPAGSGSGSGGQQRPPGSPASGQTRPAGLVVGIAGATLAVTLARALRTDDGPPEVYLDDEPAIAIHNIAALAPINGPSEIAALIAGNLFEHQLTGELSASQLRAGLARYDIAVVDAPQLLAQAPNLLVVSGHNDAELAGFLDELGRLGVLRGRTLLLNTCDAPGNADLFHRIIDRYGALAIQYHGFAITPTALQWVLFEVGRMLKERPAGEPPVHPGRLIPNAARRLLDGKGDPNRPLPVHLRDEVQRLRHAFLQVSQRFPTVDQPWGPTHA